MMSPPAGTPALPGLPHTPSPGTDHSFPQEGLSSCIPLPWTLGPADPSGLFSCSPRQGLLCFYPRPALGALDPSPSAGPTLHPTGSTSARVPCAQCRVKVSTARSCTLALGGHTAEAPHARAMDTGSGEGLPQRTPPGQAAGEGPSSFPLLSFRCTRRRSRFSRS